MPPRTIVNAKKRTLVPGKPTKGQTRRQEENIQEDFDHNDDDSENNEDQLKIDRPLDINFEQDIARMLLPVNPQAPSNLSYYSFKDREWKKDELIDQLCIHFAMDG